MICFMTDTHRKTTRVDREPDSTDHYLRKLNELAELGLKQAEQLVAEAREDASEGGDGPKAALTLEEASLEFERLTLSVLRCVELSAKLHDDRWAREQDAAAAGVLAEELTPHLESELEEAIAQLAGPDKPTRH
jgi:hypothetical protein